MDTKNTYLSKSTWLSIAMLVWSLHCDFFGSVLHIAVLGIFLVVPVIAVLVPAALVTCTTVVVLLSFVGKPRRQLVVQGKAILMDMTVLALKGIFIQGDDVLVA
ncbi:hypothetical protein ACHQM5_017304 [Ranunculus cassubicifolius]